MEWDLKPNPWEWENIAMVYPPNGDGSGSSTPSAKGGDAFIGLKLGRQTYFEDSAAAAAAIIVGQKVATTAAPVFSPPGKRQRAMSPGMQTPRCQVEGCKTDLTPAKDYHRRHKVCEMHSKASRCIAGGQEQRFCQQCSRFHVLTEFDEGKRSCRRRLAGHNERRRKPHPQSHTSLSIKASSPLHTGSQGLSSISARDSGRALSLLSSQSRVSRPPLHLPAQDLPQVNTTLEQFVAGNSEGNNHSTSFSPQLQLLPTGRTTTPQQQQRYAGVEKLLSCAHTSSGNRSMDKNVENSGDRHCNNSSDNFISALDGYDRSHSMLTLFQTGQQFGGFSSGTAANTRPTIDLMQTPTAQVQTLQNGSNGGGQSQSLPSSNGYSEYSPMRHFEASMFSSQQML
ncbi:unnamed protein product [Sphagnum jensenii]|uniref:SBP-type domain-containing protein n=1 Tax=Sphagnum jensenii TaxID=128206 RepID=A0ABP0WA04_9BRYO